MQYINASSACVCNCVYEAAAAAALFPQKIEEIVSDENRDEEECLCAIREMESSVPYFCVMPAFSHPLCRREFYKRLFPSFFF